MENKFENEINQFEKRIFESFFQGGKKLENLSESLDKMICLMFSHDKPKDDNSYHQRLRRLKYKKLKELCDFDVDVDFTLVYEDESGTENYYDFLGDLNLYDDLHPDSKDCMDLECLRDSYVKTDSEEVIDSYIKDITCNGEPTLMRLELKPQYQKYETWKRFNYPDFISIKEEN